MLDSKLDYFTDGWNWIEVIGNSLVIRTVFISSDLTWVLALLLLMKGVASLQVFESQRVLIQMIV